MLDMIKQYLDWGDLAASFDIIAIFLTLHEWTVVLLGSHFGLINYLTRKSKIQYICL